MRDISDVFKEALLQRETGEVAIWLLTVTHPEMFNPVYLCLNTQPIVSRGNTYFFFPFQVTRPEERHGETPTARLVVDGVDLSIISILRQIEGAPTVVLEIVLADSPDIVEYQTAPMQWRSISYTTQTIEGTLHGPRIMESKFPADDFTPSVTPGVFFGGPNL